MAQRVSTEYYRVKLAALVRSMRQLRLYCESIQNGTRQHAQGLARVARSQALILRLCECQAVDDWERKLVDNLGCELCELIDRHGL